MSGIIWGIVNLNKVDTSIEVGKLMIKPMKKYKIDT